jgi:cell division protein FtsI (penicillin-binding protein 3)
VQHDKEIPVQLAQASLKPKADPELAADVASAPFAPEPEGPVPAEQTEIAQQGDGPRAPNLMGKTMRDVVTETAALGLVIESRGSGVARTQKPLPGTVLQPGERIMVQFGR